jgi:hypothetical protein
MKRREDRDQILIYADVRATLIKAELERNGLTPTLYESGEARGRRHRVDNDQPLRQVVLDEPRVSGNVP